MLDTFNGSVPALDISATGLISDGTIYLQPCYTRYGVFPYCRFMRHGVFSVTKSMGAAIAMLRLAQKYGPEVFDLRIKDYVQVTARHDGWDEVTFGDALNMATGIGDKPDLKAFTGEEDEDRFDEFLAAGSAQDKLDVCFSYGDYPWGPGEIARYNSINTFVLSVAMSNFLKSKEGPDADIWDMVVDEVYQPIGIQHAPIIRTVEPDGSRGVPIFGYGLYPTVDDVAKVAALYHDGGRYQGQQLLHAGQAGRGAVPGRRCRPADRRHQPVRPGHVQPVLLVRALSHRDRSALPGSIHVGLWRQPRRPHAQRHDHLSLLGRLRLRR